MGGLARSYRRASHKLGRALLRAGSEPSARSQSEAKTVAGGWETYARRRRDEDRLGDEWNEPGVMGLDVATADEILPYLDRVVFAPFLGTNDVLLEIGPGGGRFTELLLPKCRKLIAVDTSPTMLELLRDRFGDDGRIDYQLGDGLGLGGVTSSSVDSAFSYGVFVHLQHWDIYNYLRELHRVLKPGGKAIIQHSNTFSDLGWERFESEVPRQLNRHKLPFTFTLNSAEIMLELVRRAALEPVESVTDMVRRDCVTLLRKPEAV
jgi:ubiquinone/menaquinone biosynthesis C-methylase UbiE